MSNTSTKSNPIDILYDALEIDPPETGQKSLIEQINELSDTEKEKLRNIIFGESPDSMGDDDMNPPAGDSTDDDEKKGEEENAEN